jgi:hypothetical protein
MARTSANYIVGRVDIGIRTTVRLGKVLFVAKGCKRLQNMFKNVFGPLAASSQVYTFRAMQ